MKVIIIDSGINIDHPVFCGKTEKITQFDIRYLETSHICLEKVHPHDEVGHGTSIMQILMQYQPDEEYIMISLLNKGECVEKQLNQLFVYIFENMKYDAVIMCAGLEYVEKKEYMENICNQIAKKGLFIASFSNSGGITYPAAFDSVVGVDYSLSCIVPNEYQVVYDSPIDFRGIGHPQKLASIGNTYKIQMGASFSTAHMAGKIITLLENGNLTKDQVKKRMEKEARRVVRGISPLPQNKWCFDSDIQAISIFPVQKETRTIIRNSSQLRYNINKVLDLKYRLGVASNQIREEGLCIEVLPLERYKTKANEMLVIGHFTMFPDRIKRHIKTLLSSIVEKGIVAIMLFDDYEFTKEELIYFKSKTKVYIHKILQNSMPINRFSKLHLISKPVLGIFGTGPRQGKFSLQLRIKERMEYRGYAVACLGTEPYATLFRFDEVYPMGLNSEVFVSGYEAVMILNEKMHRLDREGTDLIIVGAQSQCIPTGSSNMYQLNTDQYSFIQGTEPDAYFLCASIEDNPEYILRTVQFLQSIHGGEVLAIVLADFVFENINGYLNDKRSPIDIDRLELWAKHVSLITDKKVVILNENTPDTLCDMIETHFEEE